MQYPHIAIGTEQVCGTVPASCQHRSCRMLFEACVWSERVVRSEVFIHPVVVLVYTSIITSMCRQSGSETNLVIVEI